MSYHNQIRHLVTLRLIVWMFAPKRSRSCRSCNIAYKYHRDHYYNISTTNQKCYSYLRKVTIDVICLTYQEATLPSLHSIMLWPLLSIYWRILSPVSRKEEIGNWIASSLFGPPTIPATSLLYCFWLTQIYVMKWYFAGSTQFETS